VAERLRVLVTRPSGQAEGLCTRIEQAGYEAVHVPAIAITGPADRSALSALVDDLEAYQLAVFVSINAVLFGLAQILRQRAWPAHTAIATVGLSTAAAVQARGLTVTHVPEHEFSSEGLLALPALRDLSGQRVAILRGNGGRETLPQELADRGARVECIEVYRRVCPADSAPLLAALLQDRRLAAVTVTSNESLQNLFELAGAAGQSRLRDLPLVVASRRQAALAAQLGFRQGAVIAGHASDEAMSAGVAQLLAGSA
jgi:uroporphyrinogen-III synthase